MIEHIPELIEAGIDSFKIEGRMKTALYVATVARTYRRAIDDYLESEEKYRANMDWYRAEIAKCTYRKFTTGFYFGKADENTQIYDESSVTCIGRISIHGQVFQKPFLQRSRGSAPNPAGPLARTQASPSNEAAAGFLEEQSRPLLCPGSARVAAKPRQLSALIFGCCTRVQCPITVAELFCTNSLSVTNPRFQAASVTGFYADQQFLQRF